MYKGGICLQYSFSNLIMHLLLLFFRKWTGGEEHWLANVPLRKYKPLTASAGSHGNNGPPISFIILSEMFVFLTTLHKLAFTLGLGNIEVLLNSSNLSIAVMNTPLGPLWEHLQFRVCIVTYLNVVCTTGSVLIGKVSYSSVFIATL